MYEKLNYIVVHFAAATVAKREFFLCAWEHLQYQSEINQYNECVCLFFKMCFLLAAALCSLEPYVAGVYEEAEAEKNEEHIFGSATPSIRQLSTVEKSEWLLLIKKSKQACYLYIDDNTIEIVN